MIKVVAALFVVASLTGILEPGPNPVGFRLIVERDDTRPALPPAKGTGRQMPIAIWYPAAKAGTPIQLRDYVIASAQAIVGTPPADPQDPIDTFVSGAAERGMTPEAFAPLLDATMLATRDAPPAPGRFPLVLFAHGSIHTESVMCEYLASHGFVVAAVQSRGATDTEYRLSRPNLDAMVADQAFAADRLQRESDVAAGPIGVIGMSNGSIAAMALALQRKVGAVVSLDGGIGEDAGGTYLRERSSNNPRAFTAPLLHFYTVNNPSLNLQHIRSYDASSRLLVIARGLRHADFLASPAFDTLVPRFTGESSTDALPGFTWINRYTFRFLDANLNGSPESREWLAADPAAHQLPAGLLTLERLPSR